MFVAYLLALATGITLFFRWPLPQDNLVLYLIYLPKSYIYYFFKYSYTLFLFTTPYIGYRLVRHPGYLAMSLSTPASAIAIGSWIALVPATVFVIVIWHRAEIEDHFLRVNLCRVRTTSPFRAAVG